jgi:hypothetical protein
MSKKKLAVKGNIAAPLTAYMLLIKAITSMALAIR